MVTVKRREPSDAGPWGPGSFTACLTVGTPEWQPHFKAVQSLPPAGGSCSGCRGCRTPKPQTLASLSSGRISDGGGPVLFENPFAGTQKAEVCDTTHRTVLPRASASSETGSQPAGRLGLWPHWRAGREVHRYSAGSRPEMTPRRGPRSIFAVTGRQCFCGPAPGSTLAGRVPFSWALLAADTSAPCRNTWD